MGEIKLMQIRKILSLIFLSLCGVFFLFLCNEEMRIRSIVSGDLSEGEITEFLTSAFTSTTTDDNIEQDKNVYITYKYPCQYITDIIVKASKAKVKLYVDSISESIIVKTKGYEVFDTLSEGTLALELLGDDNSAIYIYVPDRMYRYFFNIDYIDFEMIDDVKGGLSINAERANIKTENFVGFVEIKTQEGTININKGNLNKGSFISVSNKGNIYLNTKLSGVNEDYVFSTNEGLVKVWKERLMDKTCFDVYSLGNNGEYNQSVGMNENGDPNGIINVKIVAENGVTWFE